MDATNEVAINVDKTFTIGPPAPAHLQISGDSDIGMLVDIDIKDGTLTFGPNYQPDLAAQAFWNAISTEYREFLKWKATKWRPEHDHAQGTG